MRIRLAEGTRVVTLGPDLDWLADAEGNLRPEAARAITQPPGVPPPPPLQRAAVNPPRRRGQHRVRLATPRLAITPVWVPVVVIGAAVAGLLAGRLGSGSRVANVPDQFPSPQPVVASPSTVRPAIVNGINVNLRTGPGLFAPVLGKLIPGEAVRIGGEHAGWFVAETSSGLRGFVFGALIRGPSSAEGVPATITEPMRAVVGGEVLELRPGDRVLARLDAGGSATILLPTGVHLGVPEHAVALLD